MFLDMNLGKGYFKSFSCKIIIKYCVMKSTEKLQARKIMIKRDQISPLLNKKCNNFMGGEKTIHVRRHSVMGNKVNERG